MRTRFWNYVTVTNALAFALVMIPNALAQCGVSAKVAKSAGWSRSHLAAPHLMRAALQRWDNDDEREPSIVGMWHVKFTALTQDGAPVNMTLDDSIVVWHSDGTEIMNSSRPAEDGNFCLGVWAKVGKLRYVLNHIPWGGNDAANAPNGIGNPQTGHQLREAISLSRDGNTYSGNFAARAYDQNKQPGPLLTGVLTATPSRPIPQSRNSSDKRSKSG
jgi:hypothetical protein